APSQDDVIQLVSRLHAADVVHCHLPPNITDTVQRSRKRGRAQFLRQALNPLALRLPLWNPDRFLSRHSWSAALRFSRAGAFLWMAWVSLGLLIVGTNWNELTANWSDRVLAANNVVLLALVYVIVKLAHELGHGFAAKRFGARVTELGLMFLVFYPI